ncbi:MAG: hypothetical protein IPM23_05965 [Candidatus Melainabacteria bacterium]|nr:hypothetical protein [Candidatus Melainabacteria bacterium]
MRNQAVWQNHPDVDRMINDHHQNTRRTLYAMPASHGLPAASRTDSQREDFERGVFFDEGSPSIYNFRHSMRLFCREVRRAARFSRPLTICMVGLPELPLVYSKYGVLAQETAIRFVGDLLSGFVDLDLDICGRYETYRFLVVFPERNLRSKQGSTGQNRRARPGASLIYLLSNSGVREFYAQRPK